MRVTRRTYDYDIPSSEILNRRLLSETTYHDNTNPDGTCPGCPYHVVSFSNTGANTWEGNGRHYNTETHAGNLGNDARTVTTAWAPAGWTSGPPPGAAVLPNLLNQRTATQGASVRDEYFEHDTATGFLKGSFVYDAARDTAFPELPIRRRRRKRDKEFTRTFGASTTPARTYCSSNYPNFPSVGMDGDTFGKDYSFQNGQVLTARWINGSVGTATFLFRNLTRDTTTGWITSAKDTAGLATAYVYDILGRVTAIDPPGADPRPSSAMKAPTRRPPTGPRQRKHAPLGQRPGLDLGALRLRRPRARDPREATPAGRPGLQALHAL